MGLNNNSNGLQAFKDYMNIPASTFDSLDDFTTFLEDEYDTMLAEGDLLPEFKKAIDQYLMRDKKSQSLIKAGEQEILKKWSIK